MQKKFNIALIQMAPAPSPAASLNKAAKLISEAASQGAHVVCLPELFATPYFCQHEEHANFSLAEPIPGPTTQALAEIAAQSGATILAPLFERRGPGIYHNSLVYLTPQGQIGGLYRKMHIPDDPGYYEKFYFAPGDTGFTSFDAPQGRIASVICWDQWYPESARLAALTGALVLFLPTAIGWHPAEKFQYGKTQLDAWQTVQRGHAIANGIYVAAVNRVGHEKQKPGDAGIEFWGSSFIADPMGQIIAQASQNLEEIIFAEIDPETLESTRQHWPFLRDRRIDAYAGICKRYTGE